MEAVCAMSNVVDAGVKLRSVVLVGKSVKDAMHSGHTTD